MNWESQYCECLPNWAMNSMQWNYIKLLCMYQQNLILKLESKRPRIGYNILRTTKLENSYCQISTLALKLW